jgi:beta-glucosidase
MVHRILTPYFFLSQHKDYPSIDPSLRTVQAALYEPEERLPDVPARDVRGDHAKLIRQIAADGTVMVRSSLNISDLLLISVLAEKCRQCITASNSQEHWCLW